VNSLFGKKNIILITSGLALLAIGFFLLSRKPADNSLALNVAPFLLLLAYVVVIPVGLWLGRGGEERGKGKGV